jgi:CDP-diacylglycerol---glycerol-3-phosphate 3-phosphatidyltransferase
VISSSTDTLLALALVALMAAWLGAYALRCALRGPAVFGRVRIQGGTVFLGLAVMNAGYWALEPASRVLARARVAPWFLSAASLVPAAFCAAAIAFGCWGAAACGLMASSLLDVLDGAVARASDGATERGAVLDSLMDRYVEFLVFGGLLVADRHNPPAQALAFAALTGSILVTYSTAKAEALHLEPPRGLMKRSDRMACLIVGLALSPLSSRWIEPGLGPPFLHPWPLSVALLLIGVFAHGSAILRFTDLARRASRER